MQLHLDSEILEITNGSSHFRIQFSSPTVEPHGLPNFPYLASSIGFDRLLYTAIVFDLNFGAAVERIKSYWPDAKVISAEQNVSAFTERDRQLQTRQFGAYVYRKKLGFFARIFKSPKEEK